MNGWKMCASAVAVAALNFLDPTVGHAQSDAQPPAQHPVFPLSQSWFRIPSLADPDGFELYRKYSFVAGESPFRNVFIFNCSTDRKYPSHIAFVIPKEVDLPAIIGAVEVMEHKFAIFTMDMKGGVERHLLPGHVKGNEIFFDFVDGQKHEVARILEAKRVFISLSQSAPPLEWLVVDGATWPLEDSKVTFDQLVRTMTLLFRSCPDLDEWRIR